MSQADPIQAQLIAARRTQILDAASKVFAEKGFHGATIRDVARTANIADGTIYNYFENKTALLLGILDRLNETPNRARHFEQAAHMDLETWVSGYIRQRQGTLGEAGLDIFKVVLAEILVNPELRRLYWDQILQPTYDLAAPFFLKWVEAGSVKAVDPDLAMRAVSGMFLGVLMLRLIDDPVAKERWDELADVMAGIILHGLKEVDHE